MPISPVAPAGAAASIPTPSALAVRGPAHPAAHPAAAPAPAPPARATAPLAEVFRSLEASQARLDRVLHAARAGRTFTAGELLALQSDAHRLGQALDVAGKLVEHGVQSVKLAINAPV